MNTQVKVFDFFPLETYARSLEGESKLIEAGSEYVRYSDKDSVAGYRGQK